MNRWRRGRMVLVGLVLLTAAGVLLLRSERAGAWLCAEVRSRAPGAVGVPVRIERCRVDPLSASVALTGVSVGPDDAPVLRAAEASVSLAGLFPGGVSLQHVTVVRPVIDVTLTAEGRRDATACPLDALARLRVARLELQDGAVTLRAPGGQVVRLDGIDVRASVGRRASEVELSLERGRLELSKARRLMLGRASLTATLDMQEQLAEVQALEASLEGMTVSASGELRDLCRPAPQVSAAGQLFVPLEALARLGVPVPEPSGRVWARVSASGPLTRPSVRAEVRASQVALGPFSPGDFAARVSLADDVVLLDELTTAVGAGEVRASARLELREGLPLTAKVTTRDASLAQALARASVTGAWVDVPLSVSAEVSGRLAPAPSLSGPVEFQAGRFLLASRAYDAPKREGADILAFQAAKGSFILGVTPKAVTFSDIALAVGDQGRTRVGGVVRLGVGPVLELDVDARATAVDLADFGSISGLPWAGTGTLAVKVKGPAGRVEISGQAALRDFKLAGYSLGVVQSPLRYEGESLSFEGLVAQKGETQLFGDVALDFRDDGLATRASVQLPDGRVEDVVDLLADLSPSMENLQGALKGRVSMVAAIDSPARALAGVLAVRVSDVAYLERRLGASSLILRFERGEALVLEPAVFEGPLGTLAVDGAWRFSGPLDYRIAWSDGSLAEAVDPEGARRLGLDGRLAGRFVVSGTTDVYRVDGTLRGDEVRWRERALGPLDLTLSLVGRSLTVTGQVIAGVRGRLALELRDRWPYDSSFQLDLPDVSPFLPPSAKGLALGLSGAVTAVGPMLDYEESRVVAWLERLSVARGDVTASNVGPVELAWSAGAAEVRRFAMKGPTTEVTAEGSWGPRRVNLRTKGSVDLRLISSLAPDLERAGGRLDFTASFGGPVGAPTLIGSADLVDARFSLKGWDANVRALSGHANFSESRVVLQNVNGFLNDGRVRARGDVRLDKLSLGAMELQVDLEDVTAQVWQQVRPTASGSLLLATRTGGAPWLLTGGLEVVKLRYTQEVSLETILESARKRPVPSDVAPQEWLRFDVDIGLGEDVRVDNGLARARFTGKVKLSGTNVKPTLVGAVEAAPGAQATFRNNVFAVGRAALQFNGLWPTFDFAAQSAVREFLVNVKAFGRLEDPRLSLTAEPALSEADIVSLLTLGVTTRERLAGQAGAGLAAEALLSATGLDRQ
ncbi:MAG: translocation/assembly module TamB domain-containing protein, partial [Myxococcaceae bacterium]|nr:translocation/assembly module TamB domain-containing protein [Myxococcaceae bacterium]